MIPRRIGFHRFASLALMFCVAVASSASCMDATRTVTFDVRAHTNDGKSLVDVPFVVVSSLKRAAAKTDDQGRATVATEIAADESAVEVDVFPGGGPDGAAWTPQEQTRLAVRMRDLTKTSFIERAHQVRLSPEKTTYEVEIIAWPAVTVSGIIVGPGDRPLQTAMVQADSLTQTSSAIGRRQFELKGVRKGAQTTLFIVTRPLVVAVPLTAEQTAADVDMGKMTIPDLPAVTASIDPVILNSGELHHRNVHRHRPGLTMVAEDGSRIFGFDSQPAGEDLNVQKLVTTPGEFYKIPPGRYYIAPGAFGRTDEQVALIEAARSHMDLTGFSLPSVEIRISDVNRFEVDELKCHQAIRQLMDRLADADGANSGGALTTRPAGTP